MQSEFFAPGKIPLECIRSFVIVSRGPAYSGPQRGDCQ